MAWPMIAAIAGASALGGLFGNRAQTIKSTTKDYGYDQQNTDVTDMPWFTGQGAINNEAVGQFLRNRLNTGADLAGYIGGGLRQINAGEDIRQKLFQNQLAARGLGRSAMAARSMNSPESSRIAQQVQFLSGAPLLQRQLQNEDLGALNQWLAMNRGQRRLGQNTTFTDRVRETEERRPGNMLGGLFGGLGAGLALGMGMQSGAGPNSGGPLSSPSASIPGVPSYPVYTPPRPR